MANTNVSMDEVKKIVSGLECSPSMHDGDGGKVGGKPSIAVGGTAAAGSEQTSEFKMSRQSGKIPGYKSKFARGARQE